MTVHTAYSTLINPQNLDEKAVRSACGRGPLFSCVPYTCISNACIRCIHLCTFVHVCTNTCRAVRCASSLQSVLHEILTVIIKTWIVRAHACLRRCVHDLAQYDKGYRLVCSRCSTTPFAAQAPLSLCTYVFVSRCCTAY